jgi:hypothetical protein
MDEKEEVGLGKKVRDTVTGFEGTVIGITEWLDDNPSVGISALVEGKPETHWFPKNRVEVI